MLAGWGRRVGATFSDNLILVIPTSLCVALFDQIGSNFLGGLAGFIVVALYMFRLLSGARGQTIGNRVVASRVRDAETGRMITWQKALQRTFFMAIYSIAVFALPRELILLVVIVAVVDNFWALFDPRKQTLHDKLLGTIVVIA